MIRMPKAPNRSTASHASDRIDRGAFALETTLGVTADGLARFSDSRVLPIGCR